EAANPLHAAATPAEQTMPPGRGNHRHFRRRSEGRPGASLLHRTRRDRSCAAPARPGYPLLLMHTADFGAKRRRLLAALVEVTLTLDFLTSNAMRLISVFLVQMRHRSPFLAITH